MHDKSFRLFNTQTLHDLQCALGRAEGSNQGLGWSRGFGIVGWLIGKGYYLVVRKLCSIEGLRVCPNSVISGVSPWYSTMSSHSSACPYMELPRQNPCVYSGTSCRYNLQCDSDMCTSSSKHKHAKPVHQLAFKQVQAWHTYIVPRL